MSDSYYTPLALSELTDRVGSVERKNKKLADENYDLRKRVERLEAQFDIQGERVVQPQIYDPMKKNPDNLFHMVDLVDFESKFDETMWKMFEIIGSTGKARYPDIERVFYEEDPNFVETRIRRAAKSLTEMNVITKTVLNLPLTPITVLYSLAEAGNRLYRKKYKAAPAPSEMVKVIKEHDNLEHGYGILDLGQLLANSRQYEAVCVFNRDIPVQFNNGTQYIPDVQCLNLDGETKTYFEYERGFHTQKNFDEKLDKMCYATRVLNFVSPNSKELVNRLYPLVKDWVKRKVGRRNVIVRLTTPKELQKCNLSDHSWLVVFDLSQGVEPVACKVDLD